AGLRRGAEEAVEEGTLAVGWLSEGQSPGLDLPRALDVERKLRLAVADLEAGDAAHRLARLIGTGRVGFGPSLAEDHGGLPPVCRSGAGAEQAECDREAGDGEDQDRAGEPISSMRIGHAPLLLRSN